MLKIDRSFVRQVTPSAHHRVLVEATVLIARSLGMGTVAEGVEAADQAEVLCALQCDKGQGYFHAKPLGAETATRWQAKRAPVTKIQARTQPPPCAETAERRHRQLDASQIAVGRFDPRERMVYAHRIFGNVHWRGLDGRPTWEDIMRTAHLRRDGSSSKATTSTGGSAVCAGNTASSPGASSNPIRLTDAGCG